MQVGDWAVAIGSPFGFQATVTAGIISAKSRDIPGESAMTSGFQHFLQTDAAINPGNSGGPLLNINGEVIGINTMIASRSGGYQGIGFALPINTAVKVYNQIIKTGKVTRGSIGISFSPDDDKNRELVKALWRRAGIFVQKVEPGGPADKGRPAGGDIIIALDGKPVTRGQESDGTRGGRLRGRDHEDHGAAQRQEGRLQRGHRRPQQGLRQLSWADGATKQSEPGEGTQAKFGISIQNLNDSLRQNLGYKGPAGVLVTQVEPGSFADDIGLQANDIITKSTGRRSLRPMN